MALADADVRRVAELRVLGAAGQGARRRSTSPRRCRATRPTSRPACIPGPIATPSLPSIDAALDPNVADGYIYFVAIPDGGGKHAFAKSYKAAPGQPQEVRVLMTRTRAGPTRPTSPRRRPGRSAGAWAGGRPGRPPGPPRPAAGPLRGERRRRLLRHPARAHALPHRVRPGRRRGEGRRRLRPVPRLGRRGRHPGRLALHDPGGRARRPTLASPRRTTTWRIAGRSSSGRSGPSASASSRPSSRTRCGDAWRRPPRT